MDGLNINNLFNLNKKEAVSINKPLSVSSLYNNLNNKTEKKFDINKLIEHQDNLKKIIKKIYKEIYYKCLNKIEESNNLSKYDLFYELPTIIYGNKLYSIDDCANYIIKHIRLNHMDVLRVTHNTLFITWYNIKKNKELSI
tara:strand:+ start:208 stop:630 length:423 start_codon:yes stop_codon:yes gene_type:complete